MSKIFYDTCSLLLRSNNIFDDEESFVISSITLKELEQIKSSNYKDAEIKYAARHLIQVLQENEDKYIVHIYQEKMLQPIKQADLEINEDIKYDNYMNSDEAVKYGICDKILENITVR